MANKITSSLRNLPKQTKTAATVVGAIGAGMVVGAVAAGAAGRIQALAGIRARGGFARIAVDGLAGIAAVALLAALLGKGKRGEMIRRLAPIAAGGALLSAAKPEVETYVARGASYLAGMIPGAPAPVAGGRVLTMPASALRAGPARAPAAGGTTLRQSLISYPSSRASAVASRSTSLA